MGPDRMTHQPPDLPPAPVGELPVEVREAMAWFDQWADGKGIDGEHRFHGKRLAAHIRSQAVPQQKPAAPQRVQEAGPVAWMMTCPGRPAEIYVSGPPKFVPPISTVTPLYASPPQPEQQQHSGGRERDGSESGVGRGHHGGVTKS